VTWCSGVATSVEVKAAPGREKGEGDTNWAGANLTRQKIKKIHTIHSDATNER
jgi:hypothetical protein